MKPANNFNKSRRNIPAIIMLIAGLGFLIACSSNYGVLRTDPEVTKTFKARNPDPGYTYYYFDTQTDPQAIVGIHTDYTLASNVWTKVDLERISVERLFERVLMSPSTLFYGATLISPEGKQMGVWFSASSGATIKMRSENVIAYIRPWQPESNESDSDKIRPVP